MIILDTNVISEFMLLRPEPAVRSWLDAQAPESVWTTSVNVYELRVGVDLLPSGSRRTDLQYKLEVLFEQVIEGRVLPFDDIAAFKAARLVAHHKEAGKTGKFRDTQVAGIVLARKATLATRNTKPLDVAVVNPWTD